MKKVFGTAFSKSSFLAPLLKKGAKNDFSPHPSL
jgi:hypothetical protein